MQKRVRVRRERPSALSWALALAVTMLAVYLATLGSPKFAIQAEPADAPAARVTREVSLAGVEAHFADLGAFPDAIQARIAAAEFAPRGAAAVIFSREDGFHVLGACYAAQSDAQRIARQLNEQEIGAGVISIQVSGVCLRVTAAESDAEALADSDRTLRAAIDQAGNLALQVDRGEVTAAQARTLAAVMRSELNEAKGRLEKIAGADEQIVCAGLIEQMNDLSDELLRISQSGAAGAKLSGKLRCAQVGGMLELAEFLGALGER